METQNQSSDYQASFSVLVMSLASSAAVSMGLSPQETDGALSIDKGLARFNIDLLLMLKDKTDGKLTADERKLLDAVVYDLQMKFVQLK